MKGSHDRFITQEEAIRRIEAATGVKANISVNPSSQSPLPSVLPLTLSMPETCALLRSGRRVVREMIKDGRLAGPRMGKCYRILADDVMALFRKQQAMRGAIA